MFKPIIFILFVGGQASIVYDSRKGVTHVSVFVIADSYSTPVIDGDSVKYEHCYITGKVYTLSRGLF